MAHFRIKIQGVHKCALPKFDFDRDYGLAIFFLASLNPNFFKIPKTRCKARESTLKWFYV